MSTWYVSGGYRQDLIYSIEVKKETSGMVTINGRRRSKLSSYECYFKTWEEAENNLRDKIEKKIRVAENNLRIRKNELAHFEEWLKHHE